MQAKNERDRVGLRKCIRPPLEGKSSGRALDRHKTHRRPANSFRYRFRIDVVTLVGLHVRLHVLGRNQVYLVSLLLECTAQKMGRLRGRRRRTIPLLPVADDPRKTNFRLDDGRDTIAQGSRRR